jgi:hypothetical protein
MGHRRYAKVTAHIIAGAWRHGRSGASSAVKMCCVVMAQCRGSSFMQSILLVSESTPTLPSI